ncbi:hypothetical protein HPT27_07700 [Permianibacter sp. IMCC34836]|uniref:hypothetical protein n=1 Tax=Permianibacter fluminis TaxID=2738515 RepID=UPI0015554451|nr:hypothetical protein [Permianibacter fluminis]NQD36908.1 hypothetical protein [Permianibacter fluminis]
MLELAERLARSGWRCWLLARESKPADNAVIGKAAPLQAATLSAVQELIGGEPAPTDVQPEQPGKLPQFLLAQADAAEVAWAEANAASSRFTGIILLGAEQLPEQAPKQSVLELQIAEQSRHVAAAARARQLRWQTLPQYQQQTLLSSSKLPVTAWLGNAIDGWQRKIASQQQTLASDDSLKRQMTAQPGSNAAPGATTNTTANKPATP